jgi:TonB-linked SusC/RagA family outer membrane protein
LIKGRSHDIVKFGENLTYTYRKSSGTIRNGVDMYWSDLYSMMRADPLTPIYGDDGADEPNSEGWFGPSIVNGQRNNPIALTRYLSSDNLNQNHILRANAYLTVEPIKNLVFKSIFGYNFSMGTGRSFSPTYTIGSAMNTVESVSQSMGGGYSWNWENTITYKFSLNGAHNFTTLLGQSVEKWGMGQELSMSNGNPIFHDFEHAYINNTENITDNKLMGINDATNMHGSPWGMGRLASFFGRISYDYKNKYMATVVFRADGSSNFMRGNRWGYFPSVSAGWVMTEENFMKGTSNWLNFLKLRASWGQNGNSSIDNFQYLATISIGAGNSYNFGSDKGSVTNGSYPDILPNRDISWETSEQIDLGFDASFLRSRLGVTFDYYVKNTKDWLLRAPQLASYGTGAPLINGGDVRNSGVEIAFDWNDRVGEFQYGANVNFAYNKNEVVRIANEQGIIQGNGSSRLFELGEGAEFYRAQVGYPLGFFFGYSTMGLFQNQAQIDAYNAAHNNIQPEARPGDVIWYDRNGDNVINDADRGYIGNPYPDLNMGLNINLAWKGFDLSLTGNAVFGNQIVRSWRNWGIVDDNYTTEILGRWHGEGTSNRIPRVSKADPNGNYKRISDLFMEDGDYFKMTNITLGYDFKRLLPAANFLSQMRVYVAVQNLFTITKYQGMDPELGQAASDGWSSGIDVGYYPTPRTWMVGANFKF